MDTMPINLTEIESKWQKRWQEKEINSFSRAESRGKPLFSMDTPPPTVSGKMHLGHALGYTQADVIARFKKMKGFKVFYPFGFDDNGLATERFVEKKTGKPAKIMGRKEFIELCLKETAEAEKELEEDFKSLGLAVDWGLTYRTIGKEAIKTAQLSFLDLFEQGRMYRQESATMYCTSCETAIAQAELEDSMQESFFNDVLFELEDSKEKIIISTTRPELLPSCVAVFVNPEDERHKNLAGKKVKVPLFGQVVEIKKDERVSTEKGTGIVMCCTFGDQIDMEWQKAFKLPLRISIGLNGKMNELAGKFSGLKIKDARKQIIEELREKGLLKEQRKITHAVNVHERCKTEVEFLVSKQWFIKYLDLKKFFISEAGKIKWHPKHMKVRLDHWVNGLQWDWCVSRQRFFGVPFPVWYCKKCGTAIAAEKDRLPVDPLEDRPEKNCECGNKEFEPEKDVFDTWFTSSLTPQINAKWGTEEKKFKELYPMSLRPQGHDIITLWAFNTIVKGLFHHRQLPWNEIMINGFALDPQGKKMSKSKGNVINPRDVMKKYSADALRYWSCSVKLGEDVPYQEKELVAGTKFVNKVYNAANFIAQNTKGSILEEIELRKLDFQPEDKWILSRINSLVKDSLGNMEEYNFARVLNESRDFFWLEFCDYYLEEVKNRIYREETVGKTNTDAARYCLLYVLNKSLLLLAPFLPHITEESYQEMLGIGKKKESIHLEAWPEADAGKINEYYEKLGAEMNAIISAVRKYKSREGLPLNSEINKANIFLSDKAVLQRLEEARETIRETMKILTLNIVVAEAPEQAVAVNADIKIEVEA